MKTLLATLALVFSAGAGAQTVSWIPPKVAVYTSTTGSANSWVPASNTASVATPLPHRPPPFAVRCTTDGTGNANTWASCNTFTAGTGTAINPPPIAAYVGTSTTGPWNPATGTQGSTMASVPPRYALWCSSNGTEAGPWGPCSGTGGSGSVSQLPPVGLYCTKDGTGGDTTWVPCAAGSAPPTTIIATIFNEGSPGSNLTGTQPATNVPGSTWIRPSSGATDCQFVSGGGVTCPSINSNDLLSVGSTPPSNYTVTFSGLTNNNGMQYIVGQIESSIPSGGEHRLAINTIGSSGVRFFDCLVNTACNTITTFSVASGATGSIVVKVAGTSVTVTAFGSAPFTYNTSTAGDPALGQYLALFNFAAAVNVGGITVTTP